MTNYKEKDFLFDFGLNNQKSIANKISKQPDFYSKVKQYKGEGDTHFNCKKTIFDAISNIMSDDKNFFITNELVQVYRPYDIKLDGPRKLLYRLDICCVYFTNPVKPLSIDIEIDGWEHWTDKGKAKDDVRDALMRDNYNTKIIRVDYQDWNLKKVLKKVLNECLLYVIQCNKIDCKKTPN